MLELTKKAVNQGYLYGKDTKTMREELAALRQEMKASEALTTNAKFQQQKWKAERLYRGRRGTARVLAGLAVAIGGEIKQH